PAPPPIYPLSLHDALPISQLLSMPHIPLPSDGGAISTLVEPRVRLMIRLQNVQSVVESWKPKHSRMMTSIFGLKLVLWVTDYPRTEPLCIRQLSGQDSTILGRSDTFTTLYYQPGFNRLGKNCSMHFMPLRQVNYHLCSSRNTPSRFTGSSR